MVVTETSVLVNFLRIDRMDLIAGHSHAFIVTDHVADEVSDRYPDQQQRFASAVEAGALSQESVKSPAEITLFGTLSASGRLGVGKCSAGCATPCTANRSERSSTRDSSIVAARRIETRPSPTASPRFSMYGLENRAGGRSSASPRPVVYGD